MTSWLKRIWLMPRAEDVADAPPAEDDAPVNPEKERNGLINLTERFLNDLHRIRSVDETVCQTCSMSVRPARARRSAKYGAPMRCSNRSLVSAD